LASIAADPDHQAVPVGYSAIDGQPVIDACREALDSAPHNGRYWIQLGRGYLKLDQGDAMLLAFEKAKALEYPAAWFALAVVYHTGNGIVEADLNRAESLYLEAYRKGVRYAALGLARLYHEAGSPFFNAEKAAMWQSRFDVFINSVEASG
jgi:TPR repeat protein